MYMSFFFKVYPFNFRIFLSVELVACLSHSVVVRNVQGFVIKVMIASEYNLVYFNIITFRFILLH